MTQKWSMGGGKDRLRNLLAEKSLIVGPITLSTGQAANYYFDCKRVTLNPEGANLVADAFLEVIETLRERPAAIGGLNTGADPILGAVMMRAYDRGRSYQSFYVRQEPKKHGTKQRIENPPLPGTKVVIVDDVITTGRSAIQAIEQAVDNGCTVVAVIALVDRNQGGAEAIRQHCDRYIPLFTLGDFPEIEKADSTAAHAYP